MNIKQALKLSAIVDKLDIEIKNPKAGQEEVGADLMLQLVKKAHKAEPEIIQFIASIKGCSVEEAGSMDFVETIMGIVKDPRISGFFKSAAKSGIQG